MWLLFLQYENIRQADMSTRYKEWKNYTGIQFPSELDMARFCTQDCAARYQTRYHLVGIWLHEGGTNSGHYISLSLMGNGNFLRRDGEHVPKEISRRIALDYRDLVCGLLYAAMPYR